MPKSSISRKKFGIKYSLVNINFTKIKKKIILVDKYQNIISLKNKDLQRKRKNMQISITRQEVKLIHLQLKKKRFFKTRSDKLNKKII